MDAKTVFGQKKENSVKKTFTLTPVANRILEDVAAIEGVSQSEILSNLMMTAQMELTSRLAHETPIEVFEGILEAYQQKRGGSMTYDKSREILMFMKDYILPIIVIRKNRMITDNQYFWVKSLDLRDIPEITPYREAMEKKEFYTKEQVEALVNIAMDHLSDRIFYANDYLFRIFVLCVRNSWMEKNHETEELLKSTKRLIRDIF